LPRNTRTLSRRGAGRRMFSCVEPSFVQEVATFSRPTGSRQVFGWCRRRQNSRCRARGAQLGAPFAAFGVVRRVSVYRRRVSLHVFIDANESKTSRLPWRGAGYQRVYTGPACIARSSAPDMRKRASLPSNLPAEASTRVNSPSNLLPHAPGQALATPISAPGTPYIHQVTARRRISGDRPAPLHPRGLPRLVHHALGPVCTSCTQPRYPDACERRSR
jgi:hypothetical protein